MKDYVRKTTGHTQLLYALAQARRRGEKADVFISQQAAEEIVIQFRLEKKIKQKQYNHEPEHKTTR
jgi:flavoprotein